uniref:ubiquitinyl hydrolase 1 n=1 Tax=Stegastes partitus TaxID=144197 RepID=A0A3B4ZNV5_9TELE
KRPYGMGRDPEDYLYDLYAVCNHHGTMQGGHYTGNRARYTTTGDGFSFHKSSPGSHCKNSIDGQWYCFDDSDVHPISEDDSADGKPSAQPGLVWVLQTYLSGFPL